MPLKLILKGVKMDKIGLSSNFITEKVVRVANMKDSSDDVIRNAISMQQNVIEVESSVLDVLSLNNQAFISTSQGVLGKTEWTRDELFYLGFTNDFYFDKIGNENGQDIYRLKSDLVVLGQRITGIEQLKELLGLTSIDEYLSHCGMGQRSSEQRYSFNTGFSNGLIGADIQCSSDFVGEWNEARPRTLVDVLTEIANTSYDYLNCASSRTYPVVALMFVLNIQKGESEDSIRQKLNEYFKNIGGSSEDGINYSVDEETLLRALYRDSEDFKRGIDLEFEEKNTSAEIDALTFDLPKIEYTANICNGYEISVRDFEEYWSGADVPELYHIEAMKNIEKYAGITESDSIEQKRAKMQAFLNKVKESMNLPRNSSVTPDMIELYALQNGLVKQRTYSEEDLSFLLESGKVDNLEQCFDKIQNEDGSYSYQLKRDLKVYRTYFYRDNTTTFTLNPVDLVSMYDEVSIIESIDTLEMLAYYLGIDMPDMENNPNQQDTPLLITDTPRASVELKDTPVIEVLDFEASMHSMEETAQRYSLINSKYIGLYYMHQASDEYAMVWNPMQGKFNSIAIKVNNPDGSTIREFSHDGKALKRNSKYIYHEALVQAFSAGYHPTNRIGVFEKDGIYYKYNSETGVFKEIEE